MHRMANMCKHLPKLEPWSTYSVLDSVSTPAENLGTFGKNLPQFLVAVERYGGRVKQHCRFYVRHSHNCAIEKARKGLDRGVSVRPRQGGTMIDRATRHELRVPLRYRRTGQKDWCAGETINMSESGILFTSNEWLEVDARLEITFQTVSNPLPLERATRQALVVRRTLNNWPETRLIFAAKFCS